MHCYNSQSGCLTVCSCGCAVCHPSPLLYTHPLPHPASTCCRCGLTAADHTGDGSGGRAWRERHCTNYVTHPSV